MPVLDCDRIGPRVYPKCARGDFDRCLASWTRHSLFFIGKPTIMPIDVACHSCERKYRLKDELIGKKFKCRDCGAIVLASHSEAAAPRVKPKRSADASPRTRQHPRVRTRHRDVHLMLQHRGRRKRRGHRIHTQTNLVTHQLMTALGEPSTISEKMTKVGPTTMTRLLIHMGPMDQFRRERRRRQPPPKRWTVRSRSGEDCHQ